MKQLVLSVAAGSLLLASAATQTPDADRTAWAEHRAMRVLYAGWPGGSREKAFEAFLKQWFDKVGILDLEKLTMATAKDWDVVVADWCSQYGNDGYPKRENSLYSPKIDLDDSFTKPIVAMDYVSTALRSRFKLDWL
jgi:hypothetical protein